MFTPDKTTRINLPKGRVIAVQQAAGVAIRCTNGLLWLSVSGLTADLFLAKGEIWHNAHRQMHKGRLVIESLSDSEMEIRMPRSTWLREDFSAFSRLFGWLSFSASQPPSLSHGSAR